MEPKGQSERPSLCISELEEAAKEHTGLKKRQGKISRVTAAPRSERTETELQGPETKQVGLARLEAFGQ